MAFCSLTVRGVLPQQLSALGRQHHQLENSAL
jgi:hypothetical protein